MDIAMSESSQEDDDDMDLFTEQEILKEMGFGQALVSRVKEKKTNSKEKEITNSKIEKENHQYNKQTREPVTHSVNKFHVEEEYTDTTDNQENLQFTTEVVETPNRSADDYDFPGNSSERMVLDMDMSVIGDPVTHSVNKFHVEEEYTDTTDNQDNLHFTNEVVESPNHGANDYDFPGNSSERMVLDMDMSVIGDPVTHSVNKFHVEEEYTDTTDNQDNLHFTNEVVEPPNHGANDYDFPGNSSERMVLDMDMSVIGDINNDTLSLADMDLPTTDKTNVIFMDLSAVPNNINAFCQPSNVEHNCHESSNEEHGFESNEHPDGPDFIPVILDKAKENSFESNEDPDDPDFIPGVLDGANSQGTEYQIQADLNGVQPTEDPNSEQQPAQPIESQHQPEQHGNLQQANNDNATKRTRKSIPNKTLWKRTVNKQKRMAGDEYLGFRKTRDGKTFHDTQREARKMGPACNSQTCRKSTVRFCDSITEEQRLNIFNVYWKKMNWDQRKVFITNHVIKSTVKRRRVEAEQSRRSETLTYYLTVDNKKLKICQQMFLQTLGIKRWTVRYWLGSEKLNEMGAAISYEASHENVKTRTRCKEKDQKFLNEFFEILPKLPSHYCRSTSKKMYLETVIVSKTQLFHLYEEKCKDKNMIPLSKFSFWRTFTKLNLAIHTPKKDKCDLCSAYEIKNGSVSEEKYKEHIESKEAARKEKELDKEKAKNGLCHAFVQDVEAVKLAPCLNASSMYYKTKLNVHNFTSYNLATKDVMCYWFDETCANLEASTFATCIVDNLTRVLEVHKKPVVLWSDGCAAQNRNATLSNALLHLSMQFNVEIEQKWLVRGHTYMECDSVHSKIEAILQPHHGRQGRKEIYLPSTYHTVTLEARKEPRPYQSIYLTHDFFKDFSRHETMFYESIRPGRTCDDPKVNDLRALKYSPDGKILYKLSFDSNYLELPQPRQAKTGSKRKIQTVIKNLPLSEFPKLNKEKLPIKESKWRHLQELKSLIPTDCQAFYDSIPYRPAKKPVLVMKSPKNCMSREKVGKSKQKAEN